MSIGQIRTTFFRIFRVRPSESKEKKTRTSVWLLEIWVGPIFRVCKQNIERPSDCQNGKTDGRLFFSDDQFFARFLRTFGFFWRFFGRPSFLHPRFCTRKIGQSECPNLFLDGRTNFVWNVSDKLNRWKVSFLFVRKFLQI